MPPFIISHLHLQTHIYTHTYRHFHLCLMLPFNFLHFNSHIRLNLILHFNFFHLYLMLGLNILCAHFAAQREDSPAKQHAWPFFQVFLSNAQTWQRNILNSRTQSKGRGDMQTGFCSTFRLSEITEKRASQHFSCSLFWFS